MVNIHKILLRLLPVVATQLPFMMQQPVHMAEAASTPFNLATTAVACKTALRCELYCCSKLGGGVTWQVFLDFVQQTGLMQNKWSLDAKHP